MEKKMKDGIVQRYLTHLALLAVLLRKRESEVYLWLMYAAGSVSANSLYFRCSRNI